MSLAVANQYAKALLAVVSKPGSTLGPEQALAQLDAIEGLIQRSPELRLALLSPAIQTAQKTKAIERLGKMMGLDPRMRNFLNVVTAHRRVVLLKSIRQAFQAQLDEQLGIVRAQVASAHALSQDQRTALEAKLAGMVQKKSPRYAYAVDERLLGGLTVRIGSRVLDGSVRGRLESLRRRLAVEA
ncbi:MAG: ATP synthase F1 subunit delta [Bryobacteraceae bacterium]